MIKDMLKTLLEAPEELSIPKEPVSAAPITGDTMGDTDFAPAPSTPAAPGAPTSAPVMPTGQPSESTVQKEVLNKQLILAILPDLKSLVSTCEKTFEGEDFTLDAAKIYLNNFLESLAFYADKIANLIGETSEPEGVEMPQEEVMPPEPVAEPMPEPTPSPAPVETGTLEPEPSFGGFTNPEAFTNPNDVGAF